MAQMAFYIEGVGYGGFSVGTIYLAFFHNRLPLLYWARIAQGTGGSIATCCVSQAPFVITNDITNRDDGNLLVNFAGRNVGLKLDNVGLGCGPVSLSFKIFGENQASPIYQVERRPNVRGINSGSIDVVTTFERLVVNNAHHQSTSSIILHGIANAVTHGGVDRLDLQSRQNYIFNCIMSGTWYGLNS